MRHILPLALAVGSLAAAAPLAHAVTTTYSGTFDALNSSGVTGTANLTLDDTAHTLRVQLNASGLEANHSHEGHIHGLLDGGFADCPTIQQDTNHDGYISVFEGAAPYGPIKVNLTNPQTPFGPAPIPSLEASFSGAPVDADFPVAGADGTIHLDATYTFDMTNTFAAQAYASITPLTRQHIVLHGMTAPETVDGLGKDPSHFVYDDLLPVACTELTQTSGPSVGGSPPPVPEPASLTLVGLAAGGLALRLRRRA